MTAFPPIETLVPHAGPMCLLDEVLSHEPTRTSCSVRAGDSSVLADPAGRIGSHVALEWMAQCIAVHGGLLARGAGTPPRPGLFLGSRRATLPGGRFDADARFEVDAQLLRGSGVGPHAFACTLRRLGEESAIGEATLNIMIYEDLDALTGETGTESRGPEWP